MSKLENKSNVTNKLITIVEKQLDKCINNKKVPSKRLLDTIQILCRLIGR